ncbi:PAS domain S-box protein [Arenimonas terrae]|nr:PAS domain S-box protein [Arenimonas terrae]
MSFPEFFRTLSQPISRLSLTGWRAYVFAAAMILGAVVVRWALPEGLGSRVPFPTFFLAVFLSAWVGGWRAGLLASALTIVCGVTVFPITRPPWDWRDLVALGFVFAVCVVGAYACARLRASTDVIEKDRGWYERILDRVGEAVLVVDDAGRLRYFNSHAAGLWALDASHLDRDVGLAVVLWHEGRDAPFDGLGELIRDNEGSWELPLGLEVRAGARRVPVVGSVSRVRDPDYGDAAVVSVQDIHALREATRRIEATERRMRALFDSDIVGLFSIDGRGRISAMNDGMRRLLGYGADAGSPEALAQIADEDLLSQLGVDGTENAIAFGPFDCRLSGPSGEVWVSLGVVPITPRERMVFAIDIGARKRAESAVDSSEARFRQLAEASAAVVWQARASGALTAQIGWSEFTGAPPLASFDQWPDWVHPADQDAARQLVQALHTQRDGVEAELRFRHASGDYRHVGVRGVVLDGPATGAIEWIGTLRDIHQRRQAEEALASKEVELRLILNAMPARIAYMDADAVFQWANGNFTQWFGVAGDVKGRPLAEVLPPDAVSTLYRSLQVARRGFVSQQEWLENHPTLGLRWTTTTFSPDLDERGRVRGVISLCMDSTDRHEAEDALRRSDAEHRTLAENVPHMVWMSDAEGRLQYCNARWHEFTGQDSSGRWTDPAHPADRQAAEAALQQAAQSRTELNIEVRYCRATDGAFRWHLVRALPLLDGEDRVLRWYGTCTDIEDQRIAQETLREAHSRTTHFLATLSHELRNPLAALMASVEVLEHAALDENRRFEVRQAIQRQAWHLKRLTDDLLDISRITLGKIQISSDTIDLREVCQHVCRDFSEKAQRHEVELDCDVPDDPILVNGDPSRIRQCVDNLVSNAIKASMPGMRVHVSTRVAERFAEIIVRDEGVGIEQDAKATIFLPFSQADDWRNRGLGLGLSIVSKLVELHGGSVWVDSDGRHCGATFGIRLPVAKGGAAASAAPPADEPARSAESLVGKVLIVEDETDNAVALQYLLALEGHDVSVAEDGVAAIALAESLRPDVVICDLGLPPPLDGLQVAKRLRAARGDDIHLCAYSGYGSREDVARSLAAGFDTHLTKPATPRAIAAEILRGLGRVMASRSGK